MLRFFRVVDEAGNREKSDAMIGVVVGRPRRRLVFELHPHADEQGIPLNHFIETAGLDRDVMQLGLDHRMSSRSCRVFFDPSRPNVLTPDRTPAPLPFYVSQSG